LYSTNVAYVVLKYKFALSTLIVLFYDINNKITATQNKIKLRFLLTYDFSTIYAIYDIGFMLFYALNLLRRVKIFIIIFYYAKQIIF